MDLVFKNGVLEGQIVVNPYSNGPYLTPTCFQQNLLKQCLTVIPGRNMMITDDYGIIEIIKCI